MTTTDPAGFVCGDTVRWQLAEADYLAPDWVLSYAVLLPDGTAKTITSTAAGAEHLFVLTGLVSATYLPGVCGWQLYATHSTEGRTTLRSGTFAVQKNFASPVLTSLETKLKVANDAYESLLSKKFAQVSVAGQTYGLQDIDKLRSHITWLQSQVAKEQLALSGKTINRQIRVRFGRA